MKKIMTRFRMVIAGRYTLTQSFRPVSFKCTLTHLLAVVAIWQFSSMAENISSVHIYHDFSLPIDIRSVRTMQDLDISHALASTLVSHDDDGQIVASLCSSWHFDQRTNSLSLELRADAKWSDATSITANDVVDNFAQAKKLCAQTIPSLFESYSKLQALNTNTISFTLSPSITARFFLEKLTEPMHGILKLDKGSVRTNLVLVPTS